MIVNNDNGNGIAGATTDISSSLTPGVGEVQDIPLGAPAAMQAQRRIRHRARIERRAKRAERKRRKKERSQLKQRFMDIVARNGLPIPPSGDSNDNDNGDNDGDNGLMMGDIARRNVDPTAATNDDIDDDMDDDDNDDDIIALRDAANDDDDSNDEDDDDGDADFASPTNPITTPSADNNNDAIASRDHWKSLIAKEEANRAAAAVAAVAGGAEVGTPTTTISTPTSPTPTTNNDIDGIDDMGTMRVIDESVYNGIEERRNRLVGMVAISDMYPNDDILQQLAPLLTTSTVSGSGSGSGPRLGGSASQKGRNPPVVVISYILGAPAPGGMQQRFEQIIYALVLSYHSYHLQYDI
jgi:hypothetical protein